MIKRDHDPLNSDPHVLIGRREDRTGIPHTVHFLYLNFLSENSLLEEFCGNGADHLTAHNGDEVI